MNISKKANLSRMTILNATTAKFAANGYQYIFETIEEAQDQATVWLWTYNNERTNMGRDNITPAIKLKTAA